MEAIIAPVHDMPEVESLVATQAREPNSGLVVIPDAFTVSHRIEITSLAAHYRVPAVYWSRSFAELGGLITYGPYIVDEYRRAASYADRILKGEKPADLPVQAPTKYELVINLKTAKALGLSVPPSKCPPSRTSVRPDPIGLVSPSQNCTAESARVTH